MVDPAGSRNLNVEDRFTLPHHFLLVLTDSNRKENKDDKNDEHNEADKITHSICPTAARISNRRAY